MNVAQVARQASLRIQAKYVVASAGRILTPGQVVICKGRLVEVTSDSMIDPDLNLDQTVLMPGLINAHCHLEFSDLVQPFPPGNSFPEWIAQVVTHRRAAASQQPPGAWLQSLCDSIRFGLMEAYQSGTCLIADMVSMPWQPGMLPSADSWRHQLREVRQSNSSSRPGLPAFIERDQELGNRDSHFAGTEIPRVIAMPELLGLSRDRLGATIDWATQLISEASKRSSDPHLETNPTEILHRIGVSPHAPYSTLLEPLQQTLQRLNPRGGVAAHVAESQDELEWLEQGTGAFQRSFQRLGIPTTSPRASVDDFIELLANRDHSLLVHGNYLSEDQMQNVASSSTTVVYCPRTHTHFGHAPYPLDRFRAHGVPVIFGTDSRASSPDLQIWREVVAARARNPTLTGEQALEAVTCLAARSLGVERELGTLEPGKLAYLNAMDADASWNLDNLLENLTTTDVRLQPLVEYLLTSG